MLDDEQYPSSRMAEWRSLRTLFFSKKTGLSFDGAGEHGAGPLCCCDLGLLASRGASSAGSSGSAAGGDLALATLLLTGMAAAACSRAPLTGRRGGGAPRSGAPPTCACKPPTGNVTHAGQ